MSDKMTRSPHPFDRPEDFKTVENLIRDGYGFWQAQDIVVCLDNCNNSRISKTDCENALLEITDNNIDDVLLLMDMFLEKGRGS